MADKQVSEEGDGDDTEDGEDFDENAPDLEDGEDIGDGDADAGEPDDSKDDDDSDDVTPPKPAAGDDDDDDDVDPSDLEADLDEILRERIAANDDEDDDESPTKTARKKASVAPKRSDEWTCNQCFLIVSSSQFGTKDDPRCPSGEDPCVSLKRALG